MADASTLTHPAFIELERWVELRLGLRFEDDQRLSARRQILRLAERRGLSTASALLDALLEDPDGIGRLLAEAVTTHHTGFFREPAALERLVQAGLPSLPTRGEPHRLWSAAASTGQEVYSLTILLAERFGLETVERDFSMLGTDLAPSVVEVAERGIYRAEEVRGVSPARLERWFRPVQVGASRLAPGEPSSEAGLEKVVDMFLVVDALRRACTFRRLNLLSEPWPFTRQFSAILCRNVLYYFGREVQARLVHRMYEATLPGGWLLTGVSESLHGLSSRWETVAAGVHRRR